MSQLQEELRKILKATDPGCLRDPGTARAEAESIARDLVALLVRDSIRRVLAEMRGP